MTAKLRRTICILLMSCMIISLLPVTAFAITPEVIYLKPNANWVNTTARFAAFFYGGGNEVWVDMTATDCDGIYECAVPDGYTYVIFCCMNPSALTNNWNNKWLQSVDLVIPTDGTNLYAVAADAWEWGGGTWHIFEVPTDEEETTAPTEAPVQNYKYYVAGTMNNWATNNDDYGMELVDGVYTVTVIVAAGNYQFKVTDGSWDNSWGVNGGHGTIEFVLTEEAEITINFDEISKITTFTSSALGEVETFDYYLVGEMNGWNASSDCGMQKNGAANTADGNTLRALYCYGKSTEALSN